MKVLSTVTALAACLTGAQAMWKGFNVDANNIDGSCKSTDDWATAFRNLQNLPGDFTSVRLYASSDCNTLANAVPAAISTGTGILVGVWAYDATHYQSEKDALESAILTYGHDWIIAISVGSEDLYRAQTDHLMDPATLANRIHDVRGMVRQWGVTQDVGHVDTWTAWVDRANDPVTAACDFIGTDGYPYFQATPIENAAATFWDSVNAVRDVVNQVNPGKWVWITETGWPVSGDTYGGISVASVAAAQEYWKAVACNAFDWAHTFWYTDVDYNASPSFGVLGADGKPVYDLSC